MEVLEQNELRKKGSLLKRIVLTLVSPSQVLKGETPYVYDAALDAVVYNELEKLLTTTTGQKFIEVIQLSPRLVFQWHDAETMGAGYVQTCNA